MDRPAPASAEGSPAVERTVDSEAEGVAALPAGGRLVEQKGWSQVEGRRAAAGRSTGAA